MLLHCILSTIVISQFQKNDRFAIIKLCHSAFSADGIVKCQINQIASLIKVSILEATHSVTACSVVVVNAGIAAAEAEVASAGVINRTAPVVAEVTDIEGRTIAVEAVARHGQLKWGGKGSCAVVLAPT